MGRRERRTRTNQPGHNRHHLIFYRTNYTDKHAKMLRSVFVYEIDEEVHRELHKRIDGIPRPSDSDLKRMWALYNDEHEIVDAMTAAEACKWLMLACDDIGWQNAMYDQWKFLEAHLGR